MPTLAENRRARHEYAVLETFQAGLELNGQEVKSIKRGSVSLAGSYITFLKGELWLVGSVVPPYQEANAPSDYDPRRPRKLLMRGEELRYLLGKTQERGLTLVPLSVYTVASRIKLGFGLAKGRRKADKRQAIRRREAEREMRGARG